MSLSKQSESPFLQGTNLTAVGDYNRSVVLDTIRKAGQISRVEVSHLTGLTSQTVTNMVRKLIDSGLVQEEGTVTVGRGKPRTAIRLNPDGRYAVGIHLEPAKTTVILINLAGHIIDRDLPDLPDDSAQAIAALASTVSLLLGRNGIPGKRMGGIGIAIPGPVDARRGTVLDPPNLSGWRNVRLAHDLELSTGLPVFMEKDVTAACHGQTWAGRGEETGQDFLFMYMGLGIAFGTVRHGHVYQGRTGNVGEMGHIVVDTSGPACWCGQRGCVAVTCDPRSLVKQAEKEGLFPAPTHVQDPRAFNDSADLPFLDEAFKSLCQRAHGGDEVCRDLLLESAGRIGRAVTILTDLWDMDTVVFGGPYWHLLQDIYLDRVAQVLRRRSVLRQVHDFKVLSTTLGGDIAAIGAASAILDHDLTPGPAPGMPGRDRSAI